MILIRIYTLSGIGSSTTRHHDMMFLRGYPRGAALGCGTDAKAAKPTLPSNNKAGPSMRLLVLPAVLLAVPAWAAEPHLARVTLSSAGVGQYEFTAHVDGANQVESLTVPLAQVDDLLASLRIDDPAGGAPQVRLPGRQPVAEAFRTLPITEESLASPEALLMALVGAQVRLPGANVSGAVLSVTPTQMQVPGGGVITRHRLAVATATGLASVVLEDQPEIAFADPALRAQVAAALTAIADHRTQDRRTLEVTLPASGVRDVQFGYVVPAPVWKVSYRLTLPADGPARLQGYAVIENLSGQDWRGVQLVLTSGQPVLFHQPLYEALFADRPEAPVQVANRLTPQADEGAQPTPQGVAPPPAPALAPPPAEAAPAHLFAKRVAAPEPVAAAAEQAATQVEFRLTAPVDAAAGQSLLLPIIDRAVPVRRVALVTPENAEFHPFVALQLTNGTGAALPPGLATLYRDAANNAVFVGNALLPSMQSGDDRLLSFAADLSTQVTMTQSEDSAIVSGKAARGTLVLTLRDRNTTTYRVTTGAGEARTVLIEQPRRDGWTVTQPAGASQTPTLWRISQDVPAGTTQDIRLVTEQPRQEAVLVGSLSPSQLLEYAGSGELDPAARAGLTKVGELRAELDRRQAALATIEHQIEAIVTDQTRVRANLTSTEQSQALQQRYTAMLQQQEDELAALRTRQTAAQTSLDQQDAALKDYLAGLTF